MASYTSAKLRKCGLRLISFLPQFLYQLFLFMLLIHKKPGRFHKLLDCKSFRLTSGSAKANRTHLHGISVSSANIHSQLPPPLLSCPKQDLNFTSCPRKDTRAAHLIRNNTGRNKVIEIWF